MNEIERELEWMPEQTCEPEFMGPHDVMIKLSKPITRLWTHQKAVKNSTVLLINLIQ
mgnify:FL=1